MAAHPFATKEQVALRTAPDANPYSLPSGKPIARLMSREYGAARAETRFSTSSIRARDPAPLAVPDLSSRVRSLSESMTAKLTPYLLESGRYTARAMGMDPAAIREDDPTLTTLARDRATFAATSILNTAQDRLNRRLTALRREDPTATRADADRALREVWAGLMGHQAEAVAATEASYAVHAAALEVARRSDEPLGKSWRLDGNPCAICIDNAAVGVIPLDQAFPSGDDGPGAHVRCMCSLSFVPLTMAAPVAVPLPEPQTAAPLVPTRATVERELGVRFVPDAPLGRGRTVVLMDVNRFEESYRTNRLNYVGPGGAGGIHDPGAEASRYETFRRFLAQARTEGTAIEMPRVGVDDHGQAYIDNGRHRFAVFRDSGARYLPVVVRREEAATFRELFGARPDPADRPAAAPRDFGGDVPAIESYTARHWGGWLQSRPPAEVDAIRTYTRNAGRINGTLRGRPVGALGGDLDPGRVPEVADRLRAAVEAGRVPEDVVAYRGLSLRDLGLRPDQLAGATIPDPAFTSVSLNESLARRDYVQGRQGLLLRIRVPAGTPAAAVDLADGTAGTDRAQHELLLRPGQSYRITSVRKEEGAFRDTYVADVEIVP